MDEQSNELNQGIPSVLADFLDAGSVEEKLRILQERESELNEKIVMNMEASLDIVGSNTSYEDRIGYLMYFLRTRGRFETSRLR